MAQLSKILGSILRDMVAAQHEANMYALKLSSAYRSQNHAAVLSPPAVCLGEVELMLHCGFTGQTVDAAGCTIDHTALLRTIRELSSEISEAAVSCILSTIVRYANDAEQGEGPIARLSREKTLRRNFIAFLGRKLGGHLKGRRAEFVAVDGTVDLERLQEMALCVIDEQVLSHSDLEDVFAGDASGEIRKAVRENLQADLQVLLPRIWNDVRIGRPENCASMDVTVSSEELAKLPDESIQTFRLKIAPRDWPSDADAE